MAAEPPSSTPSAAGYRRARRICLMAILVAIIWSSLCADDLSDDRRMPAVYRLFGLEPKPPPPGTGICHHDH